MECRLRTAESFRGGVEPAWTSDKAPPRKSAGVPICMLESGELLFGDGPGAVAVVFDFIIFGNAVGRLALVIRSAALSLVMLNSPPFMVSTPVGSFLTTALPEAVLNVPPSMTRVPLRLPGTSANKKATRKGCSFLAGVLGFRTNPRSARGQVVVSFTGDNVSRRNSHKLRLPGYVSQRKNHP